MATTSSGTRSGPPGQRPPQRAAPELRVGPPARERRPALAVAAVMLILVSAAVVATLLVRAGDRTEVLAVARTVPVGRQVTVSDLKRARISSDPGLHTIPVSAAADVVGKVAATTLVPGTLLTPEQLGPSELPGRGQAIVGLDLKGSLANLALVASVIHHSLHKANAIGGHEKPPTGVSEVVVR